MLEDLWFLFRLTGRLFFQFFFFPYNCGKLNVQNMNFVLNV